MEWGTQLTGTREQISKDTEVKVGDIIEYDGVYVSLHEYEPVSEIYNQFKKSTEDQGHQLLWLRADLDRVEYNPYGFDYYIYKVNYQVRVLHTSPLTAGAIFVLIIAGIALVVLAEYAPVIYKIVGAKWPPEYFGLSSGIILLIIVLILLGRRSK